MPKFNKHTPKETLRKQAEIDVERIKKTVQRDAENREYKWNGSFFESEEDEKGKKRMKGIDSSVPGFWWYCHNVTGSNSKGYDLVCKTPHFVFIYQDGEKLTCRKCNAESTIKLVLRE